MRSRHTPRLVLSLALAIALSSAVGTASVASPEPTLEKLSAHRSSLTPVIAHVDGVVRHATGLTRTWVVVPMSHPAA